MTNKFKFFYKVAHKWHPNKKLKYLRQMSTKQAENLTSDIGAYLNIFSYEKHQQITASI
jgi:hypothetical protein